MGDASTVMVRTNRDVQIEDHGVTESQFMDLTSMQLKELSSCQ